jgi:hypothetical protein
LKRWIALFSNLAIFKFANIFALLKKNDFLGSTRQLKPSNREAILAHFAWLLAVGGGLFFSLTAHAGVTTATSTAINVDFDGTEAKDVWEALLGAGVVATSYSGWDGNNGPIADAGAMVSAERLNIMTHTPSYSNPCDRAGVTIEAGGNEIRLNSQLSCNTPENSKSIALAQAFKSLNPEGISFMMGDFQFTISNVSCQLPNHQSALAICSAIISKTLDVTTIFKGR